MQSLIDIFSCAFCCKSKKKSKKSVFNTAIDAKSLKYDLCGDPNEELATFGAGCYWGTEKYFVTTF